jgi:hypothetical protein
LEDRRDLEKNLLATPRGTRGGDANSADANDDKGMDPTREEMLDGFFNLHEIEAFANEEEEVLLDNTFGKEDDPGNKDDGGGWAEIGRRRKRGRRGRYPT